MSVVLSLEGVVHGFRQGEVRLEVLRGVNFQIESGEIVALLGPSGSGKSTMLHIAGLLETPQQGEIQLHGEACGNLNDRRRTALRRQHLGFVYQYHHLLPEFTAEENVALPAIINGGSMADSGDRARKLLERMGLSARLDHQPAQLSGGEQQRVAIARALVNEPALLLADEPTGNLDPGTADSVFDILLERVREQGLAALIATHNPELAARMDRRVHLDAGDLIDLP